MEIDFNEIYNNVLEYRNENRGEYQKTLNVISPSSLGFCMRKQVLGNVEGSPDIDLLKIFDHGNIIHDKVAFPILKEYFEEVKHMKNITVINEFPFKSYITDEDGDVIFIKGFIDDLLLIYDNGKTIYVPIEIKSIGNAFYKLKEPKAEHQVQLHMYLREMNAEYGYVVYIHKATLSAKTFKIEYNEDIIVKLEDRIKKLYGYKKIGSIPPAEAMIHSDDYWFKKACDECNFINFCLSIDKGEVRST